MSCIRRWGLPVWALCLPAAALLPAAGRAADEQPAPDKAVDAVIHRALRDVINEGADMYNAQGRYQNGERDYAGCYHLYEGALMSLRPLLIAHPDLQKAIDAGLDTARNTPRVEMRAFVLREVIDKIRDATGSGGKPVTPTTPVETKTEGKVTKAEGGKLIVKPTTGEAKAFEVPDKAAVTIDGKPGKAADIKADALVTVFEMDGAVTRVEVKSAAAPPPPPPPAETRVDGKVTKAEAGKLTVKPATGDSIDVTIPDAARITIDGKAGKGADIKADATVTLTLLDGKITKIDAKNPTAPPPAPAEKTFTGKVVRADKDGVLLRDEADKDKPFAVPGTAKVTIDGKDGKLEDIKKDSTATVTSKGDEVIKVEAKSPTSPPPPPGKEALWDRLGGETGVAKVVDDFVNTAGKDPKVNFWRDPTFTPSKEQVAELKKKLVEFVSQAAGGPLKYEGKDMKAAHKGMGITDAEFDAAAADLKAALEKNGVKADDVKAVLAAVEGTRKDIVQPKAPEDKPKPDDKKPDDKPADKGDVSGAVAYKGKPLSAGSVSFIAADGKIYSSPIAKDGTYSITDVKPGEYKVAVETESAKPKSPEDKGAAGYVAIPAKYAKPETSGLAATVVKGKQTMDLDLSN